MAERTVGDVLSELTKRQKNCLYFYVSEALDCGVNALSLERSSYKSDKASNKRESSLDRKSRYRMETINSLTEEQLDLFHGLIEEACKEYHKNG